MSSNSSLSGLFKEVYADALQDLFLPSISYHAEGPEISIYILNSPYLFVRTTPPEAAVKLIVWDAT